MPFLPLLVISMAYAIGCIVTAYYGVRWRTGHDVRSGGSGAAGATNAGRILGRKAYVLIALLDIARGWLAVALAALFGLTGWWLAAAGLAVFAGHVWPVQLGFHGGKGIAPGYGVILFLCPPAAAWMWIVFGLARAVQRHLTLAGLAAFTAAPFLTFVYSADASVIALCALLALLLVFTHRTNLRSHD